MRDVRIKKTELREIVATNREKHIKEYAEGYTAFQQLFLQQLDTLRHNAERGEFSLLDLQRLQRPVSHEKDYDRALRMLELEVNDTITLDEEGMRNLVMDEWSWSEHFTASNKLYRDSVTTRR